MKLGFMMMLVFATALAGAAPLVAQSSGSEKSATSSQSSGQAAQAKSSSPQSQANGNPFPGNTTNVPVLPSGPAGTVPEGRYAVDAGGKLPPDDMDPVKSPDSSEPDGGQQQGFSSSQSGLDDLLPAPDTAQPGKKGSEPLVTLPPETLANDLSVGSYYLGNHNWRAALSRFQSALVLDPQNPDVYWGLAESERHLGDYADARQHYVKVLEYDPGSKHAKEATKALREPQIANMQAPAGKPTGATPQ